MELTPSDNFNTNAGIYVFATVIPPLLPTVFVVYVGISANRLQRKRIACTYLEGILVTGLVDAAFFDKAGTLTKQGLKFFPSTRAHPPTSLCFKPWRCVVRLVRQLMVVWLATKLTKWRSKQLVQPCIKPRVSQLAFFSVEETLKS
jgi:hypothetical protein